MQTQAVRTKVTDFTVPPANLKLLWQAIFVRNEHLTDFRIVGNQAELMAVRELRIRKLRPEYPEMSFNRDQLDYQSLIFYTVDANNKPVSTARLVVNGAVALPQDRFLTPYYQAGWKFFEWSRFAIDEGNRPLLKSYYRAVYLLAKHMGFDAIVMSMKPKDIKLHQRLLNIHVVEADMQLSYGGKHALACVVWELGLTDSRFYKWVGGAL